MPDARLHRTERAWTHTADGEPRGYIDLQILREVWFHTGTVCNLNCPDCYEHSAPGNHRLEMVSFEEVRPFIDEAVELGVEQFSFTGGEPSVISDLIRILDYALDAAPCLVLTNGTVRGRLTDIFPLIDKPNRLSFRISLDFPDRGRHDALRGVGMFETALGTMSDLYSAGFDVSVARRREEGEDSAAVDAAYLPFFDSVDLPPETPIVSFPDLNRTGTPEVTESCMVKYHTAESRAKFMCAFSRMVIKQNGKMNVCACTLVDDCPCWYLGSSLREAMGVRVMLAHPRCFSCFSGGTCCSELVGGDQV